MLEFDGMLVLVTGGAKGLGRAIAEGFARAGAQTILTDVDKTAVGQAADEMNKAGLKAHSVVADVQDRTNLSAMAADIRSRFGNIDVLVNNAGIAGRAPFDTESSPALFEAILDVNVRGTFNVTYAFVDALKQSKGAVINMSSVAGFVSGASSTGYVTSKGAIRSLTQVLARELSEHGVRVNAVAPGMMVTEMALRQQNSASGADWFLNRAMMKRMGNPEEIVGPVMFLASDLATFITGTTLAVDGGFLAA